MQEASQDCNEEWRPVVGYEELYCVSETGKIYSHRSKKIIRTFTSHRGYPKVVLTVSSLSINLFVHRLVASAFIGVRPDGQQVNHKDGNKLNNSFRNLEYVTGSQNVQHANALGLRKTSRPLTLEQVNFIRATAGRISGNSLSRSMGLDASTVSRIRNHHIYKQV